MSSPTTSVTMEIGGDLKKSKLKKFLEVLNEHSTLVITEQDFHKVLKEKDFEIGTDDGFGISGATLGLNKEGRLVLLVREQDRIIGIEDICIENNLSFIVESKRGIYGSNEEQIQEDCLYQWAPNFGEPQYIETDFMGQEKISGYHITNLVDAIKTCRNFKKLPKLINSKKNHVKTFAKKRLGDADIVDTIISSLSGLLTEMITVPPFMVS